VSGVWLRVRILNSLVFILRTTVRAMRDSLREADQSFSTRAPDHGLGFCQWHVLLECILDRDRLRKPVRDDFVIVDTARG
jgi:hypothetical protein